MDLPRVAFTAADHAVIAVYFVALFAVGLLYLRLERTSTGWFLAGRSLTVPAFVATLVATWYGGILGVGQWAHQYGLSMLTLFAFPYYVFAALFALWLAPRIRTAGLITIPDKIAASYGRGAGLVAAVYAYLLTNPAPYVLMLGTLLQLIYRLPPLTALIVGVLLSTAYVYSGGFRADVRVNVAQFLLMFGGFLMIVPVCMAHFGGPRWLVAHLDATHLSLSGGKSGGYLLAWFFVAMLTLIDPGFHQRCYAAHEPRVARRGMLISILFWMLFDSLTVTAGLYAFLARPELDYTAAQMAYPLLADQVLGPFWKGFFYVGMLATVMSTVVSYTFLSGVTFARDFVWRLRGGDENKGVAFWTAFGLVLISVIAVVMAWQIRSVVDRWWISGSLFVPGLLLPLMLSYGPRRWYSPAMAVAALTLPVAVAVVWLVIGYRHVGTDGEPGYPGGILPMYPGLAVSLACWAFAAWWDLPRRHKPTVESP
ncbi:MAG: sodium:solute symporter family protein [Armatimonadetes bacterium]|nr:sodium:solute symporter family protein [Armatimonadota bacterium]